MDGHGLVLRVEAQLRSKVLQTFGVEQVQLSLDDDFFSSLSAVVPAALLRVFRMTMHPLSLCPQLLDRMDLMREEVKCDLELGMGRRGGQKVSHATILPALRKMAVAERKVRSEGGQVRLDFLTPGSIFNRKTGLLLRFRLSACALEEACLNMDTEVGLTVLDSAAPPAQGVAVMQIRLMVLSQTMYAFLDILCVCLALLLVVLPWRFHSLYRALLQGDDDRAPGKADRGFHAVVFSHFLRALLLLPLELVTIGVGLCAPWRLKRLLSTLIRKDILSHSSSAQAVCTVESRVRAMLKGRTRSEGLMGLCLRAVRDFMGLLVLLVLALSGWRFVLLCRDVPTVLQLGEVLPMPAFLDLWVPPSRLAKLKRKKKGRMALMVGKHFGLLILDLLQLMEFMYILFTFVGFPHYIRRVLAWRAYSMSVAPQAFRSSKLVVSPTDRAAKSLLDVLPHHTLLFPYLDFKSLCACQQVSSEWRVADEDRYWMRLFLSRWPQGMVTTQVVANFKALFKDRHLTELKLRKSPPQHELDYALGHRYLLHMEFLHSLTLFRHFFLLPFKLLGVIFGSPILFISYARFTWPQARLPILLQCPLPNDIISWHELMSCLTFWKSHRLFVLGGLHLAMLIVNELSVLIACLNLAAMYVSTLGLPLLLRVAPNHSVLTALINGLLGFFLPIYILLNVYLLFLPNLVWWTTWGSWTLMLLLPVLQSVLGFFLRIVFAPLRLVGLDASSLVIWFGTLAAQGLPASSGMGALLQASLNILALTCSSCVEALLTSVDFVLFLIGIDMTTDHSWSVVVGETVSKTGFWLIYRLQLDYLLTTITAGCAFVVQKFIYIWQGTWKFADAQLTAGTSSASLVHLFPGVIITPSSVQQYMGYFLLPFDLILKLEFAIIKLLYLVPVPGIYYLASAVHFVFTSKIILQFIWFAVMGRAWYLFCAVQRQVLPNANPLWTYTLPFRFIRWQMRLGFKFIQKVVLAVFRALSHLLRRAGEIYAKTLILPTRVCNRMGFLGDLLLIPVSLLWMGWPLWIPFRTKLTYLYVPAIIATLACIVWATNIIKKEWK